ncbi:hypothetical protein POM88_009803 [Heracleum sosnowskyi]|uniref:Uncharacterized protein n=1 Tax=Heracleum sosnowskyi TaxID=360622 RepID=A0AAD8JCH5_9APIA|nr:hypothetical protein POM88_009803 [Heracleum sosnowskyi]
MEQGNASGSASSNSVGMVSTKCAANMSKSDQDCTVLSQAQENDFAGQQKEQEQPTKKQKLQRLGFRLLSKPKTKDVCWCSILRFLHPSLQFLDSSSAIAGQI